MAFEVARADAYGLDAVFVEMVRVHSAAALLEEGIDAHAATRFGCERTRTGGLFEVERMVQRLDVHVDGRLVFLRDLVGRGVDLVGDGLVFFRDAAALLAGDGDEVAHHVRRAARLEHGEVGRGCRGEAAVREVHDEVGGNLHRIEAFFRLVARVGGAAVDFDDDFALARRGHDDGARPAGRVVHEAGFRPELAEIVLLRSFDAALFADGEGHFDGAVGDLLFLHSAEHGQDSAHAADVVPGEDGLAIGINDAFVFFHHRLDMAVIGHAVHVRGEEHRLDGRVAFEDGVEIARIAAEDLAGPVFGDCEPEVREFLFQYVCDGPLFAGVDFDRYQFLEFVNDALLIHTVLLI